MGHPTENQLPIQPELAAKLAARIERQVSETPNGCWIRATRKATATGYTHIGHMVDGKRTYYYAHRVMYVAAHGAIPEGHTVDHMCEVPACCNPGHLKAVIHRANVLRGEKNPYVINARKERCVRDHEFVPHPSNPQWRHCPECNRIRQAEYRRRQAERSVA